MENEGNSYSFQNETKESPNAFRLKLSTNIENELGPKNLENLTNFATALKEELKKQETDGHLVLIGGMVLPEKQGKNHKDIDLVFYSSQLNLKEMIIKEDDKDFNEFTNFSKKISNKLGWTDEINEPYFYDFLYSFDGSVVLKPEDGIPLEVLPIREDSLKSSVDEYVKQLDRPAVILF